MYKMYIKNPTQYRKDVYKKFRNKVTNLIILTQKQYYANRLHVAEGNIKKTWDVINHALGRQNKKNYL